MTKYLKNPGAGWDNPGSTPLEDFKREIDKWKKEVGVPKGIMHPTTIFERPNLTDDDLREIGDYFEEVLGWRPKSVIRDNGSSRAVPC